MEELEPIQMTAYMPSNAPIPDTEVIVERGSTPQQLGPKLNRSAGDIVRFLLLQGEMVTATQPLTDDMIELFAAELGADVRLVDPGEEQEAALLAKFFGDEEEEEEEGDLQPRPPVITVMGHVDHGKTLLLDRIRSTNVVAGEAGGITQHIGAYQVELARPPAHLHRHAGPRGLHRDACPGREVTDIVVLVVAADDGVMPQTIEAINHAKAAEVPIVVAVNKIDRADADPEPRAPAALRAGPRARGLGRRHDHRRGLRAAGARHRRPARAARRARRGAGAAGRAPKADARGIVLEANLDIGRGPVATVIVQTGTLRVGDPIVAGAAWGRVKALIDDRGDQVKEAFPSMPVQVLGLSEPPIAGDELRVTSDLADRPDRSATLASSALRFTGYAQASSLSASPGAKLEDIFEQIQRARPPRSPSC